MLQRLFRQLEPTYMKARTILDRHDRLFARSAIPEWVGDTDNLEFPPGVFQQYEHLRHRYETIFKEACTIVSEYTKRLGDE